MKFFYFVKFNWTKYTKTDNQGSSIGLNKKISFIARLHLRHARSREGLTSLQRAGGIYGLVALSPSVGVYAGGRFTSNVPMRVVQPGTQPNNSLDLKKEDNCHPAIKEEGQTRRRQRQKSLPAVTTSYQVEVGAWHGTLRVTVCWRELLYTDDTGAAWVQNNLLY